MSVCMDYKKVVEVVLTMLRPGWRQVLLYKCRVAGRQFICVAVQLVQAKCVCCICVRSAFYRVAVIFFLLFAMILNKITVYRLFQSKLIITLVTWIIEFHI
jgi:hypothetical protein